MLAKLSVTVQGSRGDKDVIRILVQVEDDALDYSLRGTGEGAQERPALDKDLLIADARRLWFNQLSRLLQS